MSAPAGRHQVAAGRAQVTGQTLITVRLLIAGGNAVRYFGAHERRHGQPAPGKRTGSFGALRAHVHENGRCFAHYPNCAAHAHRCRRLRAHRALVNVLPRIVQHRASTHMNIHPFFTTRTQLLSLLLDRGNLYLSIILLSITKLLEPRRLSTDQIINY